MNIRTVTLLCHSNNSVGDFYSNAFLLKIFICSFFGLHSTVLYITVTLAVPLGVYWRRRQVPRKPAPVTEAGVLTTKLPHHQTISLFYIMINVSFIFTASLKTGK